MERGPSFGFDWNYRPVETPEQLFRNEIRRSAVDVLYSIDPLSSEIAKKVLEKILIKDQIDEINAYRNNPTIYQPWKKLGLFIVVDKTSQVDYTDQDSDFEVKQGDRILDIHLPPVPADQRNLAAVTSSLQLVAEYISQQKLDVKYLMGVTFEKLARVSTRQGFTIIVPELPEDIRRNVETVYRRFTDSGINGESMGRVLLCYQTTGNFLQRYLKK